MKALIPINYDAEQAKRLEEDGVEVKNGKVDLKKFGINSN